MPSHKEGGKGGRNAAFIFPHGGIQGRRTSALGVFLTGQKKGRSASPSLPAGSRKGKGRGSPASFSGKGEKKKREKKKSGILPAKELRRGEEGGLWMINHAEGRRKKKKWIQSSQEEKCCRIRRKE